MAVGSAVRVVSSFLNLFFPARCRLCAEALAEITRVPVCPACWEALKPLPPEGQCSLCGLPVAGDLAGLPGFRCGDCIRHPPLFDLARSYGVYGGALRELVHLLKYRGMTPLAQPLGERLVQAAQIPVWAAEYAACQVVIPMPLDPSRRRIRGFNQAELLAREVAWRLRLPCEPKACSRTRPTSPQAGLSRRRRQENVRGAFAADKRLVADQTVLLVDDVMTTGATLDACARALFEAGAARVLGLTLARTAESQQNIPGDPVV